MISKQRVAILILLSALGLASALLWPANNTAATPELSAKASAESRSSIVPRPWKSETFYCSASKKGQKYTFRFRLFGQANRSMAMVKRLQYKITPRERGRSRGNKFAVSNPRRQAGIFADSKLVRNNRWNNKRVSFQIRRQEIYQFRAVFELRRSANLRCEATAVF
jgi:hypothetical protein